ncbi:hypothetical protein HMPREF9088_1643 [Enterococcus italicus DSM 15952]|uniref:Uncharacterized protein n=1 Tax=Enterococcus italicus (strain DSM 15952 / CCUG 50447 / LMG 22039 / TP 1.5) TaxID=888064 RepID=E6LH03_ENTI1|nr:hypothetical protein HMPREF9088_1643 [Enterococcus italicus DSM 15952]
MIGKEDSYSILFVLYLIHDCFAFYKINLLAVFIFSYIMYNSTS